MKGANKRNGWMSVEDFLVNEEVEIRNLHKKEIYNNKKINIIIINLF